MGDHGPMEPTPTADPIPFARQTIHDNDTDPERPAMWAAVIEQPNDVWWQTETGHPGFLNFRIIECMGTGLYQDPDCQPTEDINAAFVVAGGSVMWDGCTNWATNEECMVHNCDDADTEAFAVILQRTMRVARDAIVPDWLR